MPRLSRIQALVVREPQRDLLVSAGAGSGKTTVLVESVLASLRAGVPLDRILVVTFTEKAAAEMKGRIYESLSRDAELSPLRLRLSDAWISTIHSFCLRLLRERFEKAGLAPRFRVLSEEDARILLGDAMSRVFREGYDGRWDKEENDAFERLVEMCGFDLEGEKLRAVVGDLLRYARTSEDAEAFFSGHLRRLERPAPRWEELAWREDYARRIDAAWRAVGGLLDVLCEEIAAAVKPGRDREFVNLRESLRAIDAERLATPEGQREALARLAGLRNDKGAIALPRLPQNAGVGLLKDALGAVTASRWFTEIPVDHGQALADESEAKPLTRTLVLLAQRIDRAYEEAKERLGALDFDDLQIRALRLLESLADGENAVRFRRVMIDEFQDVNALQDRILSLVGPPEGMFRVGDLKQCIYQFRLSSPEIMRDLAEGRPLVRDASSAPEGAPAWNVLLPENYRSHDPILEVVNAIGRRLFLREEIGTGYDEQALVGGGDRAEGAPEVELYMVGDPPGKKRPREDLERAAEGEDEAEGPPAIDEEDLPDLRDTQWETITERIRGLVDGGEIVRDPETQAPRPVGYADIAILLRAGANAPSLARRLEEAGIPCSLAAESSFFAAREIQDCLQILRTIDNLLDDIALASSLRSPAFGWEDAELYALRLSYPRAAHLAHALAGLAGRLEVILERPDQEKIEVLLGPAASLPATPPFDRLAARAAEALERFHGWRAAAGRLELPELIARIFQESSLPQAVASLPGGLRRSANLRKLLGLARRYAEESGHSLHRFLLWLTALEEGGARMPQAPIASESLPAVRILTIHAAKGLEFPVVFVAEMGREFQFVRQSKSPLIPGRRYLGVRILEREQYRVRMPLPLRLLRDEQVMEGLAEEKRVLYVALTRARDRLIMIGAHTAWTAPAPELRRAYRRLCARDDATGAAAAQELLRRKRTPLAWVLYALEGIPDPEPAAEPVTVRLSDLPLVVHWIPAHAPAKPGDPPPNLLRNREGSLRRLEPIAEPPADREADLAIARIAARPPLPLPGLLQHARGKLWATELKSPRDRDLFFRPAVDPAEATAADEPAEPLVAPLASALAVEEPEAAAPAPAVEADFASAGPLFAAAVEAAAGAAAAASTPAGDRITPAGARVTPAAAAAEGVALHGLLERLEFAGLTHENLEERLAAASGAVPEIAPGTFSTARDALARLLTLPLARALASGGEIHREVAFSLRVPMLEIAGALPDLREEILSSSEWAEWVQPAAEGRTREGPARLRVRAGRPQAAGDPWVLVQGRIDLVLREADRFIVLDWKSDRVDDDRSLEERIALYRGQMAIYRRAVGLSFGEPVAAFLYFLRPGILREV